MEGVAGPPLAVRLEIARESDIYEARYQARQLARATGFDAYDQAAIETAVAELATNLHRHAGRGTLALTSAPVGDRPRALDVEATNARVGPVEPGRSCDPYREGLGIGLAGVQRLMDEVRLDYVGGRFRVRARKWLPAFRPEPVLETAGIVEGIERYRVDVACRPRQAHACADTYLIAEEHGALVVLVADVLGHGREAAEVARMLQAVARRLVSEKAWTAGAGRVVEQLHEALRGSRGACVLALTVAPDGRRVEWAGAGNVRGRLWHAGEGGAVPLLVPPGVIGYSLRRVQAQSAQLTPPACLVIVSDGVDEAALDRRPVGTAEALLRRWASPRDDATAVLVRW